MEGEFKKYKYCDSKDQWIDTLVCDHEISIGKCHKIKHGCKVVSTRNISAKERQRRSDYMKSLHLKKKINGNEIPVRAPIEDTDDPTHINDN